MENTSDKRALIIKAIQSMAGKYGVYEIFADWIKCMALAFANQVDYNDRREKDYLDTINRYDERERKKLCEMMAWLVEWADEEMTDMLGYIYMHLELGSKANGQFFTPYHICRLMAKLADYSSEEYQYSNQEYLVNEPTCGAGGNIIALAESMKEQGINYQERLTVICQDIDVKAVYMAYVQMTLYGIPAICYQSNTLLDPAGKESSTGKMKTFGYVLKTFYGGKEQKC